MPHKIKGKGIAMQRDIIITTGKALLEGNLRMNEVFKRNPWQKYECNERFSNQLQFDFLGRVVCHQFNQGFRTHGARQQNSIHKSLGCEQTDNLHIHTINICLTSHSSNKTRILDLFIPKISF